jgi:ribosomal protein L40E
VAVIETIIKVVLALAAVAFVGYPFLRPPREEETPYLAPEEEQLLERKGAIEGALTEVEFDYRTGKLAEKDYQELTLRYRREQTEILSMLGEPTADPEPAAPDLGGEVAPVQPASAQPAEGVCSMCGSEHPIGAKFCGSCGSSLGSSGGGSRKASRAGAGRCRECGTELRPGNKFCGSCGAKAPARS